MYVCICKAVTDQQVYQELDQGAKNFKEISKSLGVGTQCGVCCLRAQRLIKDYQIEHSHQCLSYAAG